MVQKFISRPVLSIVVSIFIVLLGIIASQQLPITQFPDIVPPAVTVTTKYTGANAEVCAKAVVTPLERAINGVAGMTYMTSVSGNDGTSIIQVYFQVGTDPDVAAVNVQTRVQTVLDELPTEVIKAGVITEKEVNSMLLYVNLLSEDKEIDEKFIYNFADINVLPELKRIDGVGFADIMGQREYAMRVWLHPDRMFAYKLSAEDIVEALKNQNVEAAPGKIGESSGKNPQALQYVLRYTGKFTQVKQYEDLIIKSTENGQILRLKDVADIEFGSLDYDVLSKENGRPSAAILLKQRPGSNAAEVIDNVKKRLDELKTTSFPPGMKYTISYDVSRFLDASIHEVIKTLIEAFILVALVVFLFLQDWRATLVPIIAVPVSLIGTFTFMLAFGFSINLLTLFSLVLAIGIVVDNAIVVVEAVHAKMEEKDMPVIEATKEAMEEISGAILAITLVMGAVFIPVAFLSGPIGVFFRQFSVTMAISIALSGVTALTLTPALCVLLLKKPHLDADTYMGKFFIKFNLVYNRIAEKYLSAVSLIMQRRSITWITLLVFCISTALIVRIVPTGFIPTEDQGTIYVNATTPSGATLERTENVMDEVFENIKSISSIESFSSLAGFSLLTDGGGASYGMGIITLKPWDLRTKNVDEIVEEIKSKTKRIKDASIQYFPPPAVPGFGNASGFEFRIQDRTGSGDLQKLASVAKNFSNLLNQQKEIQNTFTSFDPSFPQYLLEVDQAAAAQKGISVLSAMDNLQTLLGSFYATNFIRFGQMYKVMVQIDPRYRTNPNDILKLYAKNKTNEMVPYSSFVKIKRVYGTEQYTRFNMFTSAMVNGEPRDGYSSGDALKTIQSIASKNLPSGYTIEWSGMTREEQLAGNQAIFIFGICLLFVYLLLSAQYESFLLPFPVLLFLPMGAFGTYLFLYLFGLQNNIYAQVALVMLIGLLGKNAILIVEFAIAKQKEGLSIMEAAKQGAFSRLRPILMTSLAFVAGLIPLMMASGAGAIGNKTIGTASAGGMILGTIGGLLIIPGLYVIFASLSQKKVKVSTSAKSVIVLLIFAFSFSSCQQAVINRNQKVNNELAEARAKEIKNTNLVKNSVWDKDTLLIKIIDQVIDNNLDLKVSGQSIAINRLQFMQDRGLMRPNASMLIQPSLRKFGKYTMDGVGNFDTQFSPNISRDQIIPQNLPDLFMGFQSSWEIDLWGKLAKRKKASAYRFLASEMAQKWFETSLIAEVASAYGQLIAYDKELEILRNNINIQKDALELVKIQKEAGIVNESVVQQFEAQWLNTQGQEGEIFQKITAIENQLKLWLNDPLAVIQRSNYAILEQNNPSELSKISIDQLENRLDIQQAKLELMAQISDKESAEKSLKPSLILNTMVGVQSFHLGYIFQLPSSIAYSIISGISAPLLNRTSFLTEIEKASAKVKGLEYNYQNKLNNGFLEWDFQFKSLNYLKDMRILKDREVFLTKESISTVRTLFTSGNANYLEVLTTQQNALRSELELLEINRRKWVSMVNLYKILGGGK